MRYDNNSDRYDPLPKKLDSSHIIPPWGDQYKPDPAPTPVDPDVKPVPPKPDVPDGPDVPHVHPIVPKPDSYF